MKTIGHLINGQSQADENRTQDVFNPATGEVSKRVALASQSTVEEAIANAQAAFPAWRNTPPAKRAQVMFKLKTLLEENADKICALIQHAIMLNMIIRITRHKDYFNIIMNFLGFLNKLFTI